MAWWNNNTKESEEEKWARFSEGERKYGDIKKEEFVEGTTIVEGRPPEDRWKAYEAEKKEFQSNKKELSKSAINEERRRRKEEENLQFLRDTESKRQIEQFGVDENARKKEMKEFEKELKKGGTEWELLKQDLASAGKDVKKYLKNVKDDSTEVYNWYTKQTNVKRVDPLAGVNTLSKSKKRGPGRPRKYAKVPKSGLPRGRPPSRDIRFSGMTVYDDRGYPEPIREPYVPPTQEQALMIKMFGTKKQFWGFGGNPVKVTRGNPFGAGGLIKSGDNGFTGSMFGLRRR